MSFKVGGRIIIDNNGEIDWSRLKNINTILKTAANYTYVHNCGDKVTTVSGPKLQRVSNSVRIRYDKYYGNCNCNCNCNCLCRD